MKKVWIFEWRDDEWVEHEVQAFTSKRKASKALRSEAEGLFGKKWRSIKVGDTVRGATNYIVTDKDNDMLTYEHKGYVKSWSIYQLEVK